MIAYDHECRDCGKVTEAMAPMDDLKIECECGGVAERIISCGKCYIANEDAPWLKSVREVVDKESPNPATKEFIKNPTRSNYTNWMKSEGIRPLENNEPRKPPPTDLGRVRQQVWHNHQKRNRIEI